MANPYGLHNYRMFRHALIFLTASGVGGDSLIYSNVNFAGPAGVLDRIGLKASITTAPRNSWKSFAQVQQGGHQDPPSGRRDPGAAQQKLDPAQASKDYLLLDRSRAAARRPDLVAKQIGVDHAVDSARPVVSEYMDGNNAATDPAGGPTRYTPSASARDGCMLGACQRRGTR